MPVSDDVGYVRDVCVDIIARNFNNKLKTPAYIYCEELGKHKVVWVFNNVSWHFGRFCRNQD